MSGRGMDKVRSQNPDATDSEENLRNSVFALTQLAETPMIFASIERDGADVVLRTLQECVQESTEVLRERIASLEVLAARAPKMIGELL